jgi:hypothetical protein
LYISIQFFCIDNTNASKMANFIAKSMANTIGGMIETTNVNDEWDNKLKDRMPEVANTLIDAICAFLSNNNLQSCKAKTDVDDDTVFEPPTYMAMEVKQLLDDYISSEPDDISRYLLCYIPKSTVPTGIQGGGSIITSMANKAVQNNPSVIAAKAGLGAAQMGTASLKSAASAGLGAAQMGTASLKSAASAGLGAAQMGTASLKSAASAGLNAAQMGAASLKSAPSPPGPATDTSISVDDPQLAKTENSSILLNPDEPIPQGTAPPMDNETREAMAGWSPSTPFERRQQTPYSKKSKSLLGEGGQTDFISPKKNEIENGTAEVILDKFITDIVSKFKCDETTTNYIKEKIIDTMIRSIRNKLIDTNTNKKTEVKQLLSNIAKETTKQSINKQISLIQPTIELYKNIIDKGDATVTAMILPDYLRLLLEMFLYTGYGEMLPDGKIEFSIEPSYISSHIAKIKKVDEFNKELDELMKHRPDNILLSAMEQFIQLDTAKTKTKVDNQANSINNQKALDKFKALFEKGTEEVKIGGKKKHTRKKKRHHKKRRSTRRYR